ncbi:Membrane-associated phospholipid phosphatase protein [Halorhabdus tiamatea SARL4B]|uniref:Membrane-associated phospholipid phosphatase protein n=1 Tax=Halorhabdus tiamatea SARL4B TaxID=1033806 RepID=F7PQF2_9EURY|nr:phosphatase PAP2 family protein [Halorhabdus tiamatea]ERJ06084.1 Membrane-associated phospholipid phosphatase protein [Halorhabdus tiamatea SARL4B]CCQ33286.1 phosphoesterase PA-phosphatase related protein [Halorhabdus tiamatea SARL4B]
MTVPLALLAMIVTVTVVLTCVTAAFVVEWRLIARLRTEYRSTIRTAIPSLSVLAGVLAINSVVRDVGVELSWLIGWNITGEIYAVEGNLVPAIQSLAHPWLTTYFSLTYVYGYVFLLVFPLVAYLVLENMEWFRTAATAYALNYAIGLGLYLVFIAYGPRNLLPDLTEPLLYTNWPSSQFLVSEVNANTNVFPSLHTSLSATVIVLAYRTRDVYPRWLPIATLVGGSVMLSTMYLAIHWGTDVVAGVALGVGSVWLARRLLESAAVETLADFGRGSLRTLRREISNR